MKSIYVGIKFLHKQNRTCCSFGSSPPPSCAVLLCFRPILAIISFISNGCSHLFTFNHRLYPKAGPFRDCLSVENSSNLTFVSVSL